VKAAKQLGAARKRGGEAASDAGGHPYNADSERAQIITSGISGCAD